VPEALDLARPVSRIDRTSLHCTVANGICIFVLVRRGARAGLPVLREFFHCLHAGVQGFIPTLEVDRRGVNLGHCRPAVRIFFRNDSGKPVRGEFFDA
jgi:hypothetical protein